MASNKDAVFGSACVCHANGLRIQMPTFFQNFREHKGRNPSILIKVMEFLDIIHHPGIFKTQHFRDRTLSLPSGKTYIVGPN
jgi:hypothetical protein